MFHNVKLFLTVFYLEIGKRFVWQNISCGHLFSCTRFLMYLVKHFDVKYYSLKLHHLMKGNGELRRLTEGWYTLTRSTYCLCLAYDIKYTVNIDISFALLLQKRNKLLLRYNLTANPDTIAGKFVMYPERWIIRCKSNHFNSCSFNQRWSNKMFNFQWHRAWKLDILSVSGWRWSKHINA